jgi:signal transduction histidine kinase
MLRLVVVNLVSNALKFTSMRTPAEIEIGCVDRSKKEIEVFVVGAPLRLFFMALSTI